MRRGARAALVLAGTLVAAAALLTASATAGDATRGAADSPRGFPVELLPDCREDTSFTRASDGTFRASFDEVELDDTLAGLPPRLVAGVDRGESTTFCIGVQNRTDRVMDVTLQLADVAADDDGSPTSQLEASDFGASRWLTLPTRRIEALPSGDIAWIPVSVAVPRDALAGSAYASVVATASFRDDGGGGGGANVGSIPSVAIQTFFDLEGEIGRQGSISDVRAPRLIWWDGFELAELPVLERLRGLGVATVRFRWTNEGNYSDVIGGELVVRSSLTDKVVSRARVYDVVVLRGSSRPFAVTWSRDIPLLGRFEPTLELRRSDGQVVREQLPAIWVIPSWWYLVAVVLAIGFPLWLRRRSRRRMQELLARVEAAEAHAARSHGDDGAWDDDEHGWHEDDH